MMLSTPASEQGPQRSDCSQGKVCLYSPSHQNHTWGPSTAISLLPAVVAGSLPSANCLGSLSEEGSGSQGQGEKQKNTRETYHVDLRALRRYLGMKHAKYESNEYFQDNGSQPG